MVTKNGIHWNRDENMPFIGVVTKTLDVRRYSDVLELSSLFRRTFVAIAKKVQECRYRGERSSTYVY